ncbi:hypothetical protein L1887_52044 [Cichorium endivia]|nr:hypothetical protein L1887_52044 [Cichorium endivia]
MSLPLSLSLSLFTRPRTSGRLSFFLGKVSGTTTLPCQTPLRDMPLGSRLDKHGSPLPHCTPRLTATARPRTKCKLSWELPSSNLLPLHSKSLKPPSPPQYCSYTLITGRASSFTLPMRSKLRLGLNSNELGARR